VESHASRRWGQPSADAVAVAYADLPREARRRLGTAERAASRASKPEPSAGKSAYGGERRRLAGLGSVEITIPLVRNANGQRLDEVEHCITRHGAGC
jgi:hypothetical protein